MLEKADFQPLLMHPHKALMPLPAQQYEAWPFSLPLMVPVDSDGLVPSHKLLVLFDTAKLFAPL